MDVALNPFPWFRIMRESAPVYFEQRNNMWNVFRYDDVQTVLTDYTNFSSKFIGSNQPINASLINTDPPRHRQLRSLVSQAFTPRTIERLTPRITAIVNELLDEVVPSGQMDIIHDLAYPLPVIVIAELLGIPHEDRVRFKHWSDQVVGAVPAEGRDPQIEMSEYFLEMIDQRRTEPRDDLISALLSAQIEGQNLSVDELLGFCILKLWNNYGPSLN